jgi:hypothetical protein
MRQRIALSIMVAAMALASPLAAVCGEPSYLGADEVRRLITGNTVEAQAEQGGPYRVYFDASGRRIALQPDGEQSLPWRILDDGSHCVTTGTGDDCARIGKVADGAYARYREGRIVTQWLRILPGRDLGTLAPGLYVRQTGADQYAVTLIGAASLNEAQARASVMAAAGSLCKAPRLPVMGRYRFESTEKVSGEKSGSGNSRFNQEIACEIGQVAAPVQRRPQLLSREESERIEKDIRARSDAYLLDIAQGRVDDAYAVVDGEGMGMDAQAWKNGKLAFRAMAGKLLRRSIWKITLYDNPPAAAVPGLYVAADYTNEYEGLALQCGYLMWARTGDAPDFRIVREESGNLEAGALAGMPADQLAQIKGKLHCEQR